jgi:outer membrane protein OmpA-like peptidoglycan-associated protein
MRNTVFIFFLFLAFNFHSQVDLKGLWQGIIISEGQKMEQGTIIFANLSITGKIVDGKTREEYPNTNFYAVKKIKGEINGNQLKFKQTVIEKKKTSSAITWCLFDITLTYNDSTGYLEGKFLSTDCRRNSGKMIFYRSTAKFSADENLIISQNWMETFKNDLKLGLNAPEIRIKERSEFVFEPIYFDVDLAIIKPQYEAYLLKMIRIVNGHTDLRVQITGHTDSDGSDAYNDDLSKRRSQAIIDFFLKNGIKVDKLSIEFKGEKNPIDNNKTIEGKKHNRRVDFEFIYK